MREFRGIGAGLLILTMGAFVIVSLVSHDPRDPFGSSSYPTHARVNNACGAMGAGFSAFLVDWLGITSFLLAFPCIIAAWSCVRGSSWTTIAWRSVGVALVFGAAIPLAHQLPTSRFSAPMGSGGLLGSLADHQLATMFAEIGSLFVLIPMLVVGLFLSCDGLAAWFVTAMKSSSTTVGHSTPTKISSDVGLGNEADAEDSEENDDDEVEESEPAPRSAKVPTMPVRRLPTPGPLWSQHRELRINRLKHEDLPPAPILPARPTATGFSLPSLEILDDVVVEEDESQDDMIREQALLMEQTFAQFQMQVKVVQIDMGPVVTQYEIELEPGLRARKVISLAEDLAIALRAPSVRVIAPIPGKNTVGIEVPNQQRAKVTLREVMAKSVGASASMRLPVYLGKDVKGLPLTFDLATMPHLLIAGRTGTGKSVCLNTLILSILMSRTPDQVRMLMIDPKMVEMSQYKHVPHLLHPVVTDMKKAEALLGWAVDKMEERYALLAHVGVRHIDAFNKLSYAERLERTGEDIPGLNERMPYILVLADELADLMMTSAKEVETHIIRLAQKSRAVGIHLVVATQKPTTDVITGLIKSNLPARVAFQVASRVDSMVVLDSVGAEKLLGYGDMLFLSPGVNSLIRAQGTYVSDDEVNRVTEFLAEQGEPQFAKELLELASGDGKGPKFDASDRDELYLEAVDVVVREQRGSVSLLQRALGIGYGRAARLIDFMAEDGIVGAYSGSQARDVNYTRDQWEDIKDRRFAKA